MYIIEWEKGWSLDCLLIAVISCERPVDGEEEMPL